MANNKFLGTDGTTNGPTFTAVDSSGAITGTTNHAVQIGNATGGLTSLGVAATGSTLMGSTGADPSFTGSPSFSGSVTAGTTVTASSGNITATSGNFALTAATTSSVGQITQAGSRLLHTFGTGLNNIFIGSGSGNFTLTTAANCIGIGVNSLSALTTNGSNIAIGTSAGNAITSGTLNVAIGASALSTLTTTNQNIAIGPLALSACIGYQNVAVGVTAGQSMTSATGNILLGFGAGTSYTTSESYNIQLNANGTVGESNVLRIGSATGTGNFNINQAIICGISGKTSTSGVAVLVNTSNVLGTTTSSIRFKQNVKDMASDSEAIYKLRPVTFNYKVDSSHVSEVDSQLKQYGLIAEEVEKVMPDQVTYNLDGNIESVRYLNFIPMLLNEIQKLKKRIEELENKI